MKNALVVVLALAMLSIPAKGSGNIYIGHRHRSRRPKIDPIYEIYPDLRAVKDLSLFRQNKAAEDYNLPRALTQENFDSMINTGALVYIPKKIDCVTVDPRLKKPLTALAPGAIAYITNVLAPAFCASTTETGDHSQPHLVLSSLTRTLAYQRILAKRNRNAAEALGDDNPYRRSSHSTGFTIDISRKNLTYKQFLWVAGFLTQEKQDGRLVEAIFEAGQDHFHVMVRPPSLPPDFLVTLWP